MFLYWKGFEIDGSDTDFDIILPETVQIKEFIDCFISMPLFGNKIMIFKGQENYKTEQIPDLIQKTPFKDFSIAKNCRTTDDLDNDIVEKLYAYSEGRDPHEAAYGKVSHPAMAPVKQKGFTRGNMTVELVVLPLGAHRDYDEEDIGGYTYNVSLFSDAGELPGFQIVCGPSFYYEYIMYILDYLKEHFPGMAVNGGLDCGGGWTDGCTYASSIYQYERFIFPVKHSINNTMKRLSEYSLARSYHAYYKNGWKLDLLEDLYPAGQSTITPSKKLPVMKFSAYISFVEQILSSGKPLANMVFDTAIQIILPKPEEFAQNPKAEKALMDKLPEKNLTDWFFKGYLLFYRKDNEDKYEYRINWTAQDYFKTLLALIEAGELEFIKAVNYEKRNPGA